MESQMQVIRYKESMDVFYRDYGDEYSQILHRLNSIRDEITKKHIGIPLKAKSIANKPPSFKLEKYFKSMPASSLPPSTIDLIIEKTKVL